MKKLFLLTAIFAMLSSCVEEKATVVDANLDIVPVPQEVVVCMNDNGTMNEMAHKYAGDTWLHRGFCHKQSGR